MCEVWQKYSKHENSYVKVTTSEGDPILGYMYTCDPETGNVGLLGSGAAVHLIFSAEINSVSPAGQLPDGVHTTLPAPEQEKGVALGRQTVVEALRQRRISAEVKEDEEGEYIAVLDGIATIRSPFVPASCRSTSENVVMRVRQVLSEIYAAHGSGKEFENE